MGAAASHPCDDLERWLATYRDGELSGEAAAAAAAHVDACPDCQERLERLERLGQLVREVLAGAVPPIEDAELTRRIRVALDRVAPPRGRLLRLRVPPPAWPAVQRLRREGAWAAVALLAFGIGLVATRALVDGPSVPPTTLADAASGEIEILHQDASGVRARVLASGGDLPIVWIGSEDPPR